MRTLGKKCTVFGITILNSGWLIANSGYLVRAWHSVDCYNPPVPTDLNLDELKRRLREGDYLEIATGGGAYEVWAEPLASPPAIYYEGEQHPISELDRIAEKILAEMRSGQIRCRWVEDD